MARVRQVKTISSDLWCLYVFVFLHSWTLHFVFLYFCIFAFLYSCISVFLYFWILVILYSCISEFLYFVYFSFVFFRFLADQAFGKVCQAKTISSDLWCLYFPPRTRFTNQPASRHLIELSSTFGQNLHFWFNSL